MLSLIFFSFLFGGGGGGAMWFKFVFTGATYQEPSSALNLVPHASIMHRTAYAPLLKPLRFQIKIPHILLSLEERVRWVGTHGAIMMHLPSHVYHMCVHQIFKGPPNEGCIFLFFTYCRECFISKSHPLLLEPPMQGVFFFLQIPTPTAGESLI